MTRYVSSCGAAAAFLIAGALLSTTVAPSAQAQTVTKDVHWQFQVPLTCSGNTCTYSSAPMGTNKRRVLQRVNCRYSALLSGLINFTTGDLTVMTGSREGSVFALVPAFTSALGGVVIDQQTDFQIDPGQSFRLRLGLNLGIASTAQCVITGRTQTLN